MVVSKPAAWSRIARLSPPNPEPMTAARLLFVIVCLLLPSHERVLAHQRNRFGDRDRRFADQDACLLCKCEFSRVKIRDDVFRQAIKALQHPVSLIRAAGPEQHAIEQSEESRARPEVFGKASRESRQRRS